MEERDWLERLDGHIARGNELFDRNNELFDRLNEDLRLSRLAREQSDATVERLFGAFARLTRDIADRLERAQTRYDGTLRDFESALRGFDAKLEESIAESKSHRGALVAILDRLGPGDSTAAA